MARTIATTIALTYLIVVASSIVYGAVGDDPPRDMIFALVFTAPTGPLLVRLLVPLVGPLVPAGSSLIVMCLMYGAAGIAQAVLVYRGVCFLGRRAEVPSHRAE